MSDQPPAPAPAPVPPVPLLAQFIADVAAFRDQIIATDIAQFTDVASLAAWVKQQFVDNVAELKISLAEAIQHDVVTYVQDVATVVQRMEEEEEEFLSVESAELLASTLDAGEVVCKLAARGMKKLDDVTAAKLQAAIGEFRGRAVDARTLLDEIVEAPGEPADEPETDPTPAPPPADDGAAPGEG